MAATPILAGHSALADLLTQFLLQGAIVTGVLALVLLALRRRGPALVVLLCLAVQGWVLGHYAGLKPAVAAPQLGGPKIVALNVWGRNRSYAEVVEFLRAEKPDVIVLIEVTHRWRRALLALANEYPHHVDCVGISNCDLMLFSKHPWVSATAVYDKPTYGGVIEARLILADGPLTVIGTHLMRPIGIGDLEGQMAQANLLADHVAAAQGRTVVVGDFNAVPWGRVVTTLETRTGLRVLPGLEGTWPAQMPWPLRLGIDQALVSPDVKFASRRIGKQVGSDHSPVIVELARQPD